MIHPTDTTTLTAAASALRHTPKHMRTAHLAERLEEMAGRIREVGCAEHPRNACGATGGGVD